MIRYISLALVAILCTLPFAGSMNVVYAAPSLRTKSSVMLIVNNLAGTHYDNKLTEMIQTKLHQKIDSIYDEVAADEYMAMFKDKSFEKEDDKAFMHAVSACKADYLIYVELQPFDRAEGFNLVYYSKQMTAHLLLRIIDLKNQAGIYQLKCDIKSSDSQDYGYIGSSSVAKKALDSALFRVGEAISVHLPL